MTYKDMELWLPKNRQQLWDLFAAAKAPDCRTCHYFRDFDCINEIDCTNGDQYQPAPKVVPWRTE